MTSLLIVDDSEDNLSYCGLAARPFDITVTKAHNVDEAISYLEGGLRPDVVLLDLIMPGRRPQELVARIKADCNLRSTRVVVMSSLREVNQTSKLIGADSAIRKPFTMNRLIDVLRLSDRSCPPA